jgi:hypothetical protein
METLAAISDTAFSTWVRESDTIFAYPMFILLHTIGLAIVVGMSSIVALLILGSAPSPVLAATKPMFTYIWAGFGLNAASGFVLMAADAPTMTTNPVMWVKFVFIVAVIVMMRRVQRGVAGIDAPAGRIDIRPRPGKVLATATLLCWLAAIVTGRLTAYIGPVAALMVE